MRVPLSIALLQVPARRPQAAAADRDGVLAGVKFYAMATAMVAMFVVVCVLCASEFLPDHF